MQQNKNTDTTECTSFPPPPGETIKHQQAPTHGSGSDSTSTGHSTGTSPTKIDAANVALQEKYDELLCKYEKLRARLDAQEESQKRKSVNDDDDDNEHNDPRDKSETKGEEQEGAKQLNQQEPISALQSALLAAAQELCEEYYDEEEVIIIQNKMMEQLDTEAARDEIGHGIDKNSDKDNNKKSTCGQAVLVATMLAALHGPTASFHDEPEPNCVIEAVSNKILELDTDKMIDASVVVHPRSQVTPLLIAVQVADDPSLCQLLLNRRANIAAVTADRENVVTVAAKQGRTAVLDWLIKKREQEQNDEGVRSINWNQHVSYGGHNCVTLAAEKGHVAVLDRLLQAVSDKTGPMWNHRAVAGRGAVIVAAEYDHVDVLDWLLKVFGREHAMWTHVDERGANAVCYAARSDSIEPLRFMLQTFSKEHAMWEQPDAYGENIVFFALAKGRIAVLNLLVGAFGEDHKMWRCRNNNGDNIITSVAKTRHVDMLPWLSKTFDKHKYKELWSHTNNDGNNVAYLIRRAKVQEEKFRSLAAELRKPHDE